MILFNGNVKSHTYPHKIYESFTSMKHVHVYLKTDTSAALGNQLSRLNVIKALSQQNDH